jgi:hypothetical protein
MARKTIADLEARIQYLEPYEHAAMLLMRGEKPRTFRCEEGSVDVLGLERASGGIIIRINGESCGAIFVTEWRRRLAASGWHDVYMRDVSEQIVRAEKEAVEKRATACRARVYPGGDPENGMAGRCRLTNNHEGQHKHPDDA